MKINISRKTLLFWNQQYTQMKGSFDEVLHRNRINEYYRQNGVMVNACIEKREAILNEFIVKEESGMYKTELKEQNGQQVPTLVLKEPIREKEFEEKMNALMNQTVAIEI